MVNRIKPKPVGIMTDVDTRQKVKDLAGLKGLRQYELTKEMVDFYLANHKQLARKLKAMEKLKE